MSSTFPDNELVFRQLGPDVANNFHAGTASMSILSDPTIAPTQKALLLGIVQKATENTGGLSFSTSDLTRAAVGTGIGYYGAKATASALSTVFELSPQTQSAIAIIGGVGGLLRSTGVWK